MTPAKKLSDVFKTVGLPPYTYVKPSYFGEVRSDIEQPGKHVLIEGPSGIGKSCIAYKVFEEIGWEKGKHYDLVSGRDENAIEVIRSFIHDPNTTSRPATLFIDDFHILPEDFRIEAGSGLKRLSDLAFENSFPPKVILVGIPTAGKSLLVNANDLGPRLAGYRFSRASDSEIQRVISEGETELNIIFEDADVILSESAGNFWLAQYICNKVAASNEVYETSSDVKIISADLLQVRKRIMDDLSGRFMPVAKTFAKGKRWRPGGNKPYLEILLSLTKIPEFIIAFDTVLASVPERRRPGIKAVRNRIHEVLFDSSKDVDLRAQIAFEDAGFSIEDPLFRYFLSRVDVRDIYRELGILPDNVERASVYSYDVGFSFAGEVRAIVEVVNAEMKNEDVITFYDYDQQAFLLAENLETTLGRIYAESCRYYLLFIDEHYKQKVWTKYERDIMTASSRSKHIIPIFLDPPQENKLVGVSSVTGHIDISDLWRAIKVNGKVTGEDRSTMRNRIVLPLLSKIDSSFDGV